MWLCGSGWVGQIDPKVLAQEKMIVRHDTKICGSKMVGVEIMITIFEI